MTAPIPAAVSATAAVKAGATGDAAGAAQGGDVFGELLAMLESALAQGGDDSSGLDGLLGAANGDPAAKPAKDAKAGDKPGSATTPDPSTLLALLLAASQPAAIASPAAGDGKAAASDGATTGVTAAGDGPAALAAKLADLISGLADKTATATGPSPDKPEAQPAAPAPALAADDLATLAAALRAAGAAGPASKPAADDPAMLQAPEIGSTPAKPDPATLAATAPPSAPATPGPALSILASAAADAVQAAGPQPVTPAVTPSPAKDFVAKSDAIAIPSLTELSKAMTVAAPDSGRSKDDDRSRPGEDARQAGAALAAAPAVDAATAPAAAPMASAVSAATVVKLAAQMVQKLGGKTTRFTLGLDPAGLGKVQVKVEIDAAGKLRAQMSFDSSTTAADVRGRENELRGALEKAGFDVGAGGLSFDTGAQNRGGNQPSPDQSRNSFAGGFEAALALGDTNLPAPVWASAGTNSGVDIRI